MLLFKKIKSIYLRDTDATGVVYFTEYFRLAVETLEEHFSLKEILEQGEFLLPIVHAEGEYLAPLHVGDQVEISLSLKNRGTTSFALNYHLFDIGRARMAGKVSIVHVTLAKNGGGAIPLPPKVEEILSSLAQAVSAEPG